MSATWSSACMWSLSLYFPWYMPRDTSRAAVISGRLMPSPISRTTFLACLRVGALMSYATVVVTPRARTSTVKEPLPAARGTYTLRHVTACAS